MTEKEFNKQYKSLFLPLGMYALRMTRDVGEAQDLVNQVFCSLWEKVAEGYEPDSFKTYVYRAVHNRAVSYLEREGRFEDLDTALIENEPEEETVDVSERDARLWRTVDAMPDRCRQIFLMSKRDGLSYKEIAAELSVSVKTVENQINIAFKKLRRAYGLTQGLDATLTLLLPLL